ncbi:MAG: hypothetical protein ACOC0J_00540, partial [Myxococcota bacterium]
MSPAAALLHDWSRMREILIALGIAGSLAALVVLGRMPFPGALATGAWMIGGGLLVGVPAGVLYHVALYRAVRRHAEIPRGWLWRPTELHVLVPEEERRSFLPPFLVGAAACGIIFLG